MLVVSSVIGVGIFLTPGAIAELLPDGRLILLAWLAGGLLSLAGALANAELGAMYPHAGGDYVYLREAYHPAAGFLVGWLSFLVIYTGTVATLATGFAEGLQPFVVLGPAGRMAVAVVVIVATTAVNYVSVPLGAQFNNLTGYLKVATLVGLGIGGVVLAPAAVAAPAVGSASPSSFGLALSPILFSYLGWNASVYVASEIRDPDRNVPRSLFVGLAVCTVIYLLTNAAYLAALPIDRMRGEVRVGEATARVFFGPAGGTVAAVLVLASVLGCLNATILVGPRIAYAMAIDGHFFDRVARVHARYRTPHVALVVQAACAIALVVVLQRFPSVLDYTTFAIVLATIADTTCLYRLRQTRPHARRPYRAWGYPVVPALYLVANVAIAAAMLRGRPMECAIALGVTATGIPAYTAFARRRVRRSGATSGRSA